MNCFWNSFASKNRTLQLKLLISETTYWRDQRDHIASESSTRKHLQHHLTSSKFSLFESKSSYDYFSSIELSVWAFSFSFQLSDKQSWQIEKNFFFRRVSQAITSHFSRFCLDETHRKKNSFLSIIISFHSYRITILNSFYVIKIER